MSLPDSPSQQSNSGYTDPNDIDVLAASLTHPDPIFKLSNRIHTSTPILSPDQIAAIAEFGYSEVLRLGLTFPAPLQESSNTDPVNASSQTWSTIESDAQYLVKDIESFLSSYQKSQTEPLSNELPKCSESEYEHGRHLCPKCGGTHRISFLLSGVLVGSGATYLILNNRTPTTQPASITSTPTKAPGVPLPHTINTPNGSMTLSPRHATILKYGCPNTTQLQLKSNYVSQVDYRLNTPVWVMEHLTKETLKGSADRQSVNFTQDTDIPKLFRVSNEDYFKSGYSRGHMSPASNNKCSESAMRESFLLNSNIVPQDLDNNMFYWNRMEQWVKSLATRKGFDSVYVLSGPLILPSPDPPTSQIPPVEQSVVLDMSPGDTKKPTIPPAPLNPSHQSAILLTPPSDVYTPPNDYDPSNPPNTMIPGKPFNYVAYKTIGKANIAVPTHLFKTVLAEKNQGLNRPPALFSASFIVPNTHIPDNVPLTQFQVPKHVLDKYAGLDVWDRAFASLPVTDLCSVTDPHLQKQNSDVKTICQLESAADFMFFTIERDMAKAKSRQDLDSAMRNAQSTAGKFKTQVPNKVLAAYDRQSKSLPS